MPSPRLLCPYLSDECCSYREGTIGCRQRKRRQTPRRRPEHHLRALPRVKFGIVAKAFENVLVARRRLHPGRDGTSGVGARIRIADDAIGKPRARLIIEFGRIQSDDQHLVQPGTLADDGGFWILWPGPHRRAPALEIPRRNSLAGHFPL